MSLLETLKERIVIFDGAMGTNLQVQNLTNERNYLGYSGTITSPFFGKPTTVGPMRKIDVGLSFQF